MNDPLLHVPKEIHSQIRVKKGFFEKQHLGNDERFTTISGDQRGSDIVVREISSGNVRFSAHDHMIHFPGSSFPAEIVDNKIHIKLPQRSRHLMIVIDIWNNFSLNVSYKNIKQGFRMEFKLSEVGHQQGESTWDLLGIPFDRMLITVMLHGQSDSKPERLTINVHSSTLYVTKLNDPENRRTAFAKKLWIALEMDTRASLPTPLQFQQELFPFVLIQDHHLRWENFFLYLLDNAPSDKPKESLISRVTENISSWPLQLPACVECEPLLEPQIELLRAWEQKRQPDGSYGGIVKEKRDFFRHTIKCTVNGCATKKDYDRKLHEYVHFYIYKDGQMPKPSI